MSDVIKSETVESIAILKIDVTLQLRWVDRFE